MVTPGHGTITALLILEEEKMLTTLAESTELEKNLPHFCTSYLVKTSFNNINKIYTKEKNHMTITEVDHFFVHEYNRIKYMKGCQKVLCQTHF